MDREIGDNMYRVLRSYLVVRNPTKKGSIEYGIPLKLPVNPMKV